MTLCLGGPIKPTGEGPDAQPLGKREEQWSEGVKTRGAELTGSYAVAEWPWWELK